jgi:hypothetical protein
VTSSEWLGRLPAALQPARLPPIDLGKTGPVNKSAQAIAPTFVPVKAAEVNNDRLVLIGPTVVRDKVAVVNSDRLDPTDPGPINLTCGPIDQGRVAAVSSDQSDPTGRLDRAKTAGDNSALFDQTIDLIIDPTSGLIVPICVRIDLIFDPADRARVAAVNNGVQVIARATAQVFVRIVHLTTTT